MFFSQLIGYICPIYLFIVLPVDIDTSKIQFSIVLPLCLLLMPVLFDFGLTTEVYSAFPASTGSFCTGTNMIMSLKKYMEQTKEQRYEKWNDGNKCEFRGLFVLNATFNSISVISWRYDNLQKTIQQIMVSCDTDIPQQLIKSL